MDAVKIPGGVQRLYNPIPHNSLKFRFDLFLYIISNSDFKESTQDNQSTDLHRFHCSTAATTYPWNL
jgi:hypothetical protein